MLGRLSRQRSRRFIEKGRETLGNRNKDRDTGGKRRGNIVPADIRGSITLRSEWKNARGSCVQLEFSPSAYNEGKKEGKNEIINRVVCLRDCDQSHIHTSRAVGVAVDIYILVFFCFIGSLVVLLLPAAAIAV